MVVTDEMRDWLKDNVSLDYSDSYDVVEDIKENGPFSTSDLIDFVESLHIGFSKDPSLNPIDYVDSWVSSYLERNWDDSISLDVHNSAEMFAEQFDVSLNDAIDIIRQECPVTYPIDAFTKEKFPVVIKMDTGDANSEFSVNLIEPAVDGYPVKDISDESSLLWLAKENGYSKKDFIHLMEDYDNINKKEYPFIESVHTELLNTSSHCNDVIFIGQMNLEELAVAQRQGVTVPRGTRCGLFDHSTGSGSLLEIDLQKDIYIPADKTFSILPDFDNYLFHSVSSVYGVNLWSDSDFDVHLHAGEAPLFTAKQKEKIATLLDRNYEIPDSNIKVAKMKFAFAAEFRNVIGRDFKIYDGMRDFGDVSIAERKALTYVEYKYFDPRKPEFVGRKAVEKFLKELPVSLSKETNKNILTLIDRLDKYVR